MTSKENDLESKSKKRSRPDFAERRKHNKEVAARVVKKKLTGVCRITTLECFIQRSVRGMTQMVVEASRLCNLHVLRRLEAGDPIEITSSNFFRNALCLVSLKSLRGRVASHDLPGKKPTSGKEGGESYFSRIGKNLELGVRKGVWDDA